MANVKRFVQRLETDAKTICKARLNTNKDYHSLFYCPQNSTMLTIGSPDSLKSRQQAAKRAASRTSSTAKLGAVRHVFKRLAASVRSARGISTSSSGTSSGSLLAFLALALLTLLALFRCAWDELVLNVPLLSCVSCGAWGSGSSSRASGWGSRRCRRVASASLLLLDAIHLNSGK